MQNVVKFASDTEQFLQHTDELREKEKESIDTHTSKDLPPVFNKRLFASQGSVVLTGEARRIMEKNARMREEDSVLYLSKKELQAMRCVVDGLKLIHKGQDYIKDVLSHVITFDTYNAFEYIVKCMWEDSLSCYYIIHGAVEVTYDMRVTESRNVYQPNIIYSHCSGEYVGLVSAEGCTEDLAPPATVYTKEMCHLLKIDRPKFHNLIKEVSIILNKEKQAFLQTGGSILSTISKEAKEKIVNKLQKKEFPPNTVLLRQGEVADHLVLIISGRCECYKDVFIPEVGDDDMFYLDSRESNDFFGEECVVDDLPSYCTVVTSSTLVCYKLHRSALEIMNKEQLSNIIAANKHNFPSDVELRDRGYNNSIWNKYKHQQIHTSLKEDGKLKYLRRSKHKVRERPPSLCEQHRENMFRFIDKGAQYQPMRAKSAFYQMSHHEPQSPRAQTSMSSPLLNEIIYDGNVSDGTTDGTDDDVYTIDTSTKLMSSGVAKALDKFSQPHKKVFTRPSVKELESEEDIIKMIEGEGELGRHLRQAWEVTEKEQLENDGFMENSVLVTMKTDDIVRKAKAIADQFVTKVNKRDKKKHEEEWNTILHAENKQAKMMITADKYRIKLLRKKLEGIEKRRVELNQEKYSPGEVNIIEEKKKPVERRTFFLETLEKLSEERSLADLEAQKTCDETADGLTTDDFQKVESIRFQNTDSIQRMASRRLSVDSSLPTTHPPRMSRRLSADSSTLATPRSSRATASKKMAVNIYSVSPHTVQQTTSKLVSTDSRSTVALEDMNRKSRVRAKSAVVTRTELDSHRNRQTGYLAARMVMKERQNATLNGKKQAQVYLYMPRSQSSFSYNRQ